MSMSYYLSCYFSCGDVESSSCDSDGSDFEIAMSHHTSCDPQQSLRPDMKRLTDFSHPHDYHGRDESRNRHSDLKLVGYPQH